MSNFSQTTTSTCCDCPVYVDRIDGGTYCTICDSPQPTTTYELCFDPSDGTMLIYRSIPAGICGPFTQSIPCESREQAEQFAADMEEAARLLRNGCVEDLAAFTSRNSRARAEAAVAALRNS